MVWVSQHYRYKVQIHMVRILFLSEEAKLWGFVCQFSLSAWIYFRIFLHFLLDKFQNLRDGYFFHLVNLQSGLRIRPLPPPVSAWWSLKLKQDNIKIGNKFIISAFFPTCFEARNVYFNQAIWFSLGNTRKLNIGTKYTIVTYA